MAAIPITPLLMFIGMAICVSAQKHNITLGSTLTTSKNPKWVSPNGQFAFGFYNVSPSVYRLGVWFENIPPKTLAWRAMKEKSGITVEEGSTLQLTDKGINLYDAQRNEQWSAPTAPPSQKVAAAALLDSGNFVLLSTSSETIWQSFDYPTDTLLPSQTLRGAFTMYSEPGRFQLSMQGDGNLVLYTADRATTSQGAYWSTDTYISGAINLEYILNFDPSGALYLVNSTTNITVFTITKGVAGGGQFLRRVTLDTYGILGQYVWNLNITGQSTSWSPVWRSGEDYCKDVKGQCGNNGICRLASDKKPDCYCPPQFDFIDNNDHFKGCVPKSSPGQNCSASSTMSQLQNTAWLGGSDYKGSYYLSESGCQQACKEDCLCIVVTYDDAACRMKQLPLLDGRHGTDINNRVYVKVSDAVVVIKPIAVLILYVVYAEDV